MEATMEKRSNLVMPIVGYELDRDEMSYVGGGLYISNKVCSTLLGVVLGGAIVGAGAMLATATSLSSIAISIYASFSAFLGSLGPAGWVVWTFVSAYALWQGSAVVELCYNIAKAAVTGTDVRVWVSWFHLMSETR